MKRKIFNALKEGRCVDGFLLIQPEDAQRSENVKGYLFFYNKDNGQVFYLGYLNNDKKIKYNNSMLRFRGEAFSLCSRERCPTSLEIELREAYQSKNLEFVTKLISIF